MSTSQIAEPTVAAEPSNGRHEVMELDVSGMTCGSCAARVQRALCAPARRQRGARQLRHRARDRRARAGRARRRAARRRRASAPATARRRSRPARPSRRARSRRSSSARRASRPVWCGGSRSRCRSRWRSRCSPTPQPHDPTARWIVGGARGAGAVLVRAAVPALGVGARARARHQHGHADRAQHAGELRLLDGDAAHRRAPSTSTACRSASSTCRSTTTWARRSSPRC